mgnify:CR=1 FL=1
MNLKFEEGDKAIVLLNVDGINNGEVVEIKRVDYADLTLPYLIISINTEKDAWVNGRDLRIITNSIKKL